MHERNIEALQDHILNGECNAFREAQHPLLEWTAEHKTESKCSLIEDDDLEISTWHIDYIDRLQPLVQVRRKILSSVQRRADHIKKGDNCAILGNENGKWVYWLIRVEKLTKKEITMHWYDTDDRIIQSIISNMRMAISESQNCKKNCILKLLYCTGDSS
jgi:hypothetical protein